MATYLCKEGSEEFTIDADSYAEAQEDAQIYNAVVIRKLTAKEAKRIKR